MKINWAIIKYNFFIYKTYYLIFTIVAGFYIGIVVTTGGGVSDKQSIAEASILINKMIFLIFWIVSFFDYLFLANKVFYKNIKNNRQQIMLFSQVTRRNLFLSNLTFLLIYAFSRMLLFFILVSICYAFKPEFHLSSVLWILFNITINALFIAMIFLLICLLTFENFDKQFLLMGTFGGIFLFLIILTNMLSTTITNTATFNFWTFLSYFPLFGLTSVSWIDSNSWQQYLNLPISILSSIGLILINLKLNQKIEY